MDDPPSLLVPGCIFLQTASGVSPELNTACGPNRPRASAAGPLLALGLLPSEVGREVTARSLLSQRHPAQPSALL